jgi:gluconokinase
VRAGLYTHEARRLPGLETQLPYELSTTPTGGSEVSAETLLDLIFAAIDGTLRKAEALAGNIAGVGICSFVPNVVGVDAAGNPLTPVYTWADTRSAPQARDLRAPLNDDQILARTGCPLHASYLPARLLWLKQTQPAIFTQVDKWLSIGDLAQLHLFGTARQSLSVASWGGLLHRHTLTWDAEMLSILDLPPSRLPALVDADDPLRGLRTAFASRWPHLRDVPFFPCVGDGVTSNLGSGCSGPEEIAVQVGTSGAMRVLLAGDVPTIPPGLWCYRLDRHTSLLGGALSEGGNLLDWLRTLLSTPDRSALAHEAATLPPDSHGLTVLPFVAGERSPGWRADARAAILGLSLDTRPAHLLRACQEAIAYRFALLHDLLREALPPSPSRRIIASGGALLGVEGWIRILVDVLGQPVTASHEPQAGSRGTALLTLRALGLITNFDLLPAPSGKTFTPDPSRHEIYQQAIARQVAAYRALFQE